MLTLGLCWGICSIYTIHMVYEILKYFKFDLKAVKAKLEEMSNSKLDMITPSGLGFLFLFMIVFSPISVLCGFIISFSE